MARLVAVMWVCSVGMGPSRLVAGCGSDTADEHGERESAATGEHGLEDRKPLGEWLACGLKEQETP